MSLMIFQELEKDIEYSLCQYPELIDDALFGIREGTEVLGSQVPVLKRQDTMPDGTRADLVFVEPTRVTVVEIKKGFLTVDENASAPMDVVEQISGYLTQCRIKYPDREGYQGYLVGTGTNDAEKLARRIAMSGEVIVPLIFGRDIPDTVKFCSSCYRAVDYWKTTCPCGQRFSSR